MLQAEVGDDVYGEDKTVNELQRRAAELFGKEAALFCPSGTMSNQIGIKVHTQPGDEVICDEIAHVYLYEGGGIAANSGASVRLLRGDRGRFTAAQVRDSINRRDDAHLPWTRLVAIENTVNRGGGCCWELAEIARIRTVCYQHGMTMHLDGARLFNALVARNESPRGSWAAVRYHLDLPVQGLGGAGGLAAAGLAGTHCARAPATQAHGRRDAPVRLPGGRRTVRAGAQRRTAARGSRQGARARGRAALTELRQRSIAGRDQHRHLPSRRRASARTRSCSSCNTSRCGPRAWVGRSSASCFTWTLSDAQLELLLRALHRVSLPG